MLRICVGFVLLAAIYANPVSECTINGETIAPGESVTVNCNTYVCSTSGVSIEGEAACAFNFNGQDLCIPVGSTQHCATCNLENGQPSLSMKCIGDGGACIDLGSTAPYRCGTALCNESTKQMEMQTKTACNYKGTCIEEGETGTVDIGGSDYTCVCVDPDKNQLGSCQQ